MKKSTKIALRYEKWVKDGLNLLSVENKKNSLSYYDDLYRLDLMRDNQYLIYLEYADRIKKNINFNMDHPSTMPNLSKLIDELKSAILLKNHNSMFYLNLILMEMFIDLSISRNLTKQEKSKWIVFLQFFKKSKQEKLIHELQEDHNYSANEKLKYFSRIVLKQKRNDDFKLFFQLATTMYCIRNRFMFHFNNYEIYCGIYPSISKKEELLLDSLKSIQSQLNASIFNNHTEIKSIIDIFKNNIDRQINWITIHKSGNGTLCIHHTFYNQLPILFGEFSCSLLYIIGKNKLNMFNKIDIRL